MEELYDMIFKRKSFHIFNDPFQITLDERECIEKKISSLKPLIDSIQTKIKIVPASDACKRKKNTVFTSTVRKSHTIFRISVIWENSWIFIWIL